MSVTSEGDLPAERVGAIVVAAGRSARMGFDKLWAPLGGRPVLAWSLSVLSSSSSVDRVVVVGPPVDQSTALDSLQAYVDRVAAHVHPAAEIGYAPGGARRRDSVASGLAAFECSDNYEWIVVHDGARPFLTPDLITHGLEAARETGAAVAAVPARDTIKRVRDGRVVETQPRAELWAVQTPQVFRRAALERALTEPDDVLAAVTDDASLIEAGGGTVRLVETPRWNLKVTTADDLRVAELLLARGAGRAAD